MTIPQAFDLAVKRHQAGHLAEAEILYRQILATQPSHADALHLLGVIAHQGSRNDLAVEHIRQANLIDPNNPVAHYNLGEACRAMGRRDEAVASYRRALQLKPDFPEALNNLGDMLRERGELDEAIISCRRALELRPDFSEALNNFGAALAGQGRMEEAMDAFRRAVRLKPEYAEAHLNLGVALVGESQFEEAIASFRHALQLKPGYPEAHNHLGIALRKSGRMDEAVAAYRRALELKSDYPEALNNLGAALSGNGKFDEAVAACRRALQLTSDNPEAYINLGAALAGLGHFDEAIDADRRALQLKPDYPEAHHNLGLALRERGRLDEASVAFRRALQLTPDDPQAHNDLGAALAGQNQFDEAVAEYRRALQLKPGYPEAHNNLGVALKERGELDEAIASFRAALQLKPNYPEALNNLAGALAAQGLFDDAISAYRRTLELKPDYAGAHSNLIFTLQYHPAQDGGAISEEWQRWNREFSEPLKQSIQSHSNDRDSERRLRIGYVSPDFREHVVGRYAFPLLERHNQEQFEILCYSGVLQPDWMTKRFRALAGNEGDGWRNTVGLSDARLAEMIREDRVDILVDLAMHSAGNRLPMFCLRPAPVQVTWLAYPGSTGLDSINYRLTDAHMDPPGESPAWSSEEPVRLPDCWCCYDSMGESPEVNPLPALSAKGVTFGSLNNFAKVHEGVLARWARVLEAVEGSRLLMTCPEGQACERVRAFLEARGIARKRVELAGVLPRLEYLRLYQRIDIGLDPHPFNGMTTTCDALWMGVPVFTLPGAMPAARAGLSLLSSIGLPEFAVSSEEEYVRAAAALAGNLPRLASLRATLRQRMQSSPLMDAPRFARNVEAAYRSMWRTWCSSQ